ncbi:LCP family protein [Streptomyces beijiangensis]|uniref:LCP family protein n=1 Tax=Streptomyces beijiangensis TaxID=163361 RepID=A0A939FCI5_9ACTN|nr:LCP family protein [Streptomyces beijiangensis]MBO0515696.1 LCP family protein [Streptomyces beijiangensis]
MDAQGRGRAENIDPADQWVFDPNTGNYELRLNPSAPQSEDAPRPSEPSRRRDVPPQRSRQRGGNGKNGPDGAPPSAGRRKAKPKKSGKKKALLWIGGVMALVVVAGSVGVYLVYQHLAGNISSVDVGNAGTGSLKKDQALNILVIGTDKRTGSGNKGYGDSGSVGHADTNILFHLSKDRTNATAMSIPRDLMTDIPDCPTKQPDGSTKVIPGTTYVRFNESLGQDGRDPGCTMRTVQAITGIKVDHFMMADFNAVKTLSTAVGGVDICLAKDINDADSHLNLPKGPHNVKGEQALAFVRTRHSVGFGGDLSRIELQQQFLSSLIRKMKSDDILTDPTKMYGLADAATKALTVDSAIKSVGKLKDLGMELKKVDTKNITFTTMPVIDNPKEPKPVTVVVSPTKSAPVFSMIRDDISLTEVKKKASAAKSAQDALLKGTQAKASDVRVKILNGGAVAGSAGNVLVWLQNSKGVLKSSNDGNAPADVAKTTLVYGPNQADQARKLADLMGLPAAALKPAAKDSVGRTPMTLTLGPDFKSAGTPIATPTKAPEDIQRVEADKTVCAK